MNLDAQIENCSKCNSRFTGAIDQRIEKTPLDDICNFGDWLHDEGKKLYGCFASYDTCLHMHSKCYLVAGKIASAVNSKKLMDAQAMLGSGTPIAVLSTTMAVTIMHLAIEAGEWD